MPVNLFQLFYQGKMGLKCIIIKEKNLIKKLKCYENKRND